MFQHSHRWGLAHIKRLGMGWLLAAMCSSAYATVLPHRTQSDVLAWLEHYQPTVLQGGGHIAYTQFIGELSTKRVIFVGEVHDRYDHHLNQLALLKALHQKNPHISIGVEWFQQPFQPMIDDFLAGNIDEKTLLQQTQYYDRWRYDYRMLRPVLEYAKANRIPVIALNAPAELTRKVSRGGLAALTPAERAVLPSTINPPDTAYRTRLEKVFTQHNHEKSLEHFLTVQRVWDETMAHNVVQYLSRAPQSQMLVFSGFGHIIHRNGIPQDVAQAQADWGMATVISADGREIPNNAADYILKTEPLFLPPSGRLGVMLSSDVSGVFIKAVAPNSASQQAGLQIGDKIISIDAMPMRTIADILSLLANKQPQQRVQLQILRSGKTVPITYSLTLQ